MGPEVAAQGAFRVELPRADKTLLRGASVGTHVQVARALQGIKK